MLLFFCINLYRYWYFLCFLLSNFSVSAHYTHSFKILPIHFHKCYYSEPLLFQMDLHKFQISHCRISFIFLNANFILKHLNFHLLPIVFEDPHKNFPFFKFSDFLLLLLQFNVLLKIQNLSLDWFHIYHF